MVKEEIDVIRKLFHMIFFHLYPLILIISIVLQLSGILGAEDSDRKGGEG